MKSVRKEKRGMHQKFKAWTKAHREGGGKLTGQTVG